MSPDINTAVETFFLQSKHKQYKKGETILNPDDVIQNAYYIKEGYVKAFSLSPEGVELTIHLFAPHAYFPMMSVLSDLPNRYYYEALVDTEVYIASKESVASFLQSNPGVLS